MPQPEKRSWQCIFEMAGIKHEWVGNGESPPPFSTFKTPKNWRSQWKTNQNLKMYVSNENHGVFSIFIVTFRDVNKHVFSCGPYPHGLVSMEFPCRKTHRLPKETWSEFSGDDSEVGARSLAEILANPRDVRDEFIMTYCWFMEEIRLPSWYGKYPIIYKIWYIPGGAGFHNWVVVSKIFFYVHPLPGEMIQFD